ncbi:fatty-acyl-CoA synthase [Amycolatopsis bartoniae]|uniref:Fatty-acyl-CoA synthase n=1 Tax=Amycolatopsis bartoniae TaxID=941986 RepID=A0A8H9IYJ2_9PSEU|nr:long-chain fatty acid--CoA ligase [Amycolatopsis bartoniae]MBB2938427.1 fatty-acyl-CoA synthase [Amycolatopsis bartoniae]TVT06082.1 long-chain fatty acid--CoA ligase [Amycolatopsis bartoniae]GHF71085.1 fatty-acyl-CoA synthase [Amycolatopsis bartoniae]
MRDGGLGSWPVRRARMTPDRTALVHRDERISYAELARRTAALARGLRERGVRRGDRVAYLGPNHPAYLETLFATGSLGAIFVPLNTRLTEPEREFVLSDAGVSVLLRPQDVEEHRRPGEPFDEPVTLDDPCLIMYTSGSTGRPKGAVLSHGNLTWNCVNVLVESDLSGKDITLVVAPLFHAAALGMSCLPTLLKGGTCVLEESFDPARALELIERHRITTLFGVPAMYDAIAAQPRWADADLSSVRALLCGGSPVPESTIRRYLDRGLVFVQGYGMTEASPGVLILDPEAVHTKAGTAGVPSFFTDVKIVNAAGERVPPGERGEVVVRGPNVMLGYWNRPDATEEALAGGWLHSGDVAVADEDGFVTVVDRIKDMIISGGENVYPAEVESALYAHPAVELCAVVGTPDPRWGEVPRAVVVLREGATATAGEIQEFLRERLAGYKVPKEVEFWTELPRTGSGKVRKAAVKKRLGEHTA